jgi:putative DNA primase/helicase
LPGPVSWDLPPPKPVQLGGIDARHGGPSCWDWTEKMQKWHIYDGVRYVEDLGGRVIQLAKQLLRRCQELIRDKDECNDVKLAKHLKSSESNGKIKAMLALAQSEMPVDPLDLDANPMRLNVSNGTINLKNGQLNPHNRCDLITKLTRIAFDKSATCPIFMKFLDEITCGNQELEEYMQKLIGYGLTGSIKEQSLYILYGLGANGKSTFVDVLKILYGEYGKTSDISTFTYKQSEQIRNDLARLFDSRVVTSVEIQEGKLLDESVIKQVTGGDPVTCRFLFKEHFEYVPKWKLLWL